MAEELEKTGKVGETGVVDRVDSTDETGSVSKAGSTGDTGSTDEDKPTGKPKPPHESESLDKLIVKYSLPAIISNLVASFYNIVDQIFIGHIIGVEGNAATNITYPLVIFITAAMLLIGIGGVSNFSISLGRKDIDRAKKFVGNTMMMGPVIGIVITIVTLIFTQPLLYFFGATAENYDIAYNYLKVLVFGFPFFITSEACVKLVRADGAPRYAMICSVVGALLNCILNPILMSEQGFGMGIAGAALATVICQIVAFCLVMGYFVKFKAFKITIDMLVPDFAIIKQISALGFAIAINQIAMMATQIVMNNTLKVYGDMSIYGSTIPFACVGVITKVNAIYMGVMVGIAQGAQPLFGYNYGAGKYDIVIDVYKKCIKYASVFSVFAFIMFQCFPREIIALFGSGEELYFEFGISYFKTFLFMTFLNGVQPVTSNFFTAIGLPIKSAIVALTKQFLFLIPLISILSKIFGLDGMLYAGPIADTLAFTITMIFVNIEIRHLRERLVKAQGSVKE